MYIKGGRENRNDKMQLQGPQLGVKRRKKLLQAKQEANRVYGQNIHALPDWLTGCYCQ